ncbi:U-box domain-containing protein 21-like [Salvia miltiorrhiza]|uniref:U-box domain-containing protein 21-like n=1 Tax=Salvia miltiorrhiza TaxID=226208 RepID=UPI0025AB616A|nr:U-box domain-containing protein 21-like [Salvia miltiorrhiza]
MLTSWRRRRAKKNHRNSGDLTIPNHFLCPISLHLMEDPVTLSTGTTYDRRSIETWIEAGNATCPVTNQVLRDLEPIPNHAIRKIIQDWCRSHGVHRIPTPRIPITSFEVSEIFARIFDANDEDRCRELVSKIKESAKESDRNIRCFVSNGAGRVLSAAFGAFSRKGCAEETVAVLAEILSAMMMLTPVLDEETSRNLSSPPSLQKIVWFLRFGSLSGRRNAVLALKSIVSFDEETVGEVVKMGGALEALVKLIKEPICPATTKASLVAMYHLVKQIEYSPSMRLAEMGLVQLLLEMVVEAERSVCEKALGVLDGMCSNEEVRERARENALMIPVVVKKVLRVSDMATEFSVSIMLKLVRSEEESAAVEALGAGAFQKLLLVLQIGSDEVTKEKVTELLKVLNRYRNRVECVDSLDFKHLRRPF